MHNIMMYTESLCKHQSWFLCRGRTAQWRYACCCSLHSVTTVFTVVATLIKILFVFSHSCYLPQLLTPLSPQVQNYPFTLKPYHKSYFLSSAKTILLRKSKTLNMLWLLLLCSLWTEEIMLNISSYFFKCRYSSFTCIFSSYKIFLWPIELLTVTQA